MHRVRIFNTLPGMKWLWQNTTFSTFSSLLDLRQVTSFLLCINWSSRWRTAPRPMPDQCALDITPMSSQISAGGVMLLCHVRRLVHTFSINATTVRHVFYLPAFLFPSIWCHCGSLAFTSALIFLLKTHKLLFCGLMWKCGHQLG